MQARFLHTNLNVLNLERSLEFYRKALGLTEQRRKELPDFTLAFLGDGQTDYQLELTWLKDRKEPYDLGDNESHVAFHVGISKRPMRCMRKWAASALKTKRWESILSRTRMAIGWRSSADFEESETGGFIRIRLFFNGSWH